MGQHRLTEYIVGISAVEQSLEPIFALEVKTAFLVNQHGQVDLCDTFLHDSLDAGHKACLCSEIRPIGFPISE